MDQLLVFFKIIAAGGAVSLPMWLAFWLGTSRAHREDLAATDAADFLRQVREQNKAATTHR